MLLQKWKASSSGRRGSRAASREQPAGPSRIPASPAAAWKAKRAPPRTRANRGEPRPKRRLEERPRCCGFWAPPLPFASHPHPRPPTPRCAARSLAAPAGEAAKRKAAVSVGQAGTDGRIHRAGHPENGYSSCLSLNLRFVSVKRMNCSHLKRVLFRWMVY